MRAGSDRVQQNGNAEAGSAILDGPINGHVHNREGNNAHSVKCKASS